MDALEESRDLAANDIPVVIVDPLTRVWDFDGRIEALQEEIHQLQVERMLALEYAIKNGIEEDAKYRLDKKVRKSRILDVTRFREVFPQEFEMACSIERKDLMAALDSVGKKINLTLVDRLVKKPALEAAQGVVTIKESVSYQVVPK